MRDEALNLRYFLWRDNLSKENWAEQVAGWLEPPDLSRARRILRVGDLTAVEIDRLSAALNVSPEELQYGRAFSSGDVLKFNLQYLFEVLGHGAQKRIADDLGVHETTVSHWVTGKSPPKRGNQVALARVLGLRPDQPLDTYPHFLNDEPVTDQGRRLWLHERIDIVDDDELRVLFPALQRMLDR